MYFCYFSRLPQKLYKHSMDFIDVINSVQKSWKAAPYPEHEMYTLQELQYRAGGPASRIPVWVFTCTSRCVLRGLDIEGDKRCTYR